MRKTFWVSESPTAVSRYLHFFITFGLHECDEIFQTLFFERVFIEELELNLIFISTFQFVPCTCLGATADLHAQGRVKR